MVTGNTTKVQNAWHLFGDLRYKLNIRLFGSVAGFKRVVGPYIIKLQNVYM